MSSAGERTCGAARARARALRRELHRHELLLADFAKRERLSPVQRLLFAAAVHDDLVAARIGAYAVRMIRPSQLLTPRILGRAARERLTARRPRGVPSPAIAG